MKVTDVWEKVEKAGLPNHENDEINVTLDRMAKGKFSLKEKFELAVVRVDTKDIRELAACAKLIVDSEYKGDAKAALAFLKDVHKSGIGPLDFSQLVRNGTAHRLIELQKCDPAEFAKVCAGKYADVAALNVALGGPSAANKPAGLLASRQMTAAPS